MKKRKKSKRIGGPGRPKLYGRHVVLAVKQEMLEDIDELAVEGETRLAFIRGAIALEILRRRKHKAPR